MGRAQGFPFRKGTLLGLFALGSALAFAPASGDVMPQRIVAEYTVDSRLKGKDPRKSMLRLGNYVANAKQEKFELNENWWAKDIDFSCVSPWNTKGGNTRAGVAISRRHVLFCSHFPLQLGAKVYFRGTDGKGYGRILSATNRVSVTDLTVGLLDEDLPLTVHPAAILPDDYEKYIGSGAGLPVVSFDYEEKAIVSELLPIPGKNRNSYIRSRKPASELRSRFFEPIIAGDSGNPCFLVFNQDPVLLYTLHSGGAGGGPSVFHLKTMIQYEMDRLKSGYKLKEYVFPGK
jgi:hypothetical protein